MSECGKAAVRSPDFRIPRDPEYQIRGAVGTIRADCDLRLPLGLTMTLSQP